jgi:predicted enzyme related to lactoylglutathione lyase
MRVLSSRPSLEVRDVAASIAAYQAALDLTVTTTLGDPPTFALLESDGLPVVALAASTAPAVAEIAVMYLEVDDVDRAHAKANGAGATEVGAIVDHPWGLRDFTFRDPDGHLIAVGQRVEPTER